MKEVKVETLRPLSAEEIESVGGGGSDMCEDGQVDGNDTVCEGTDPWWWDTAAN